MTSSAHNLFRITRENKRQRGKMKLNKSKQNFLELCFNLNYYEVTNGDCNKPQQPQVQQGGNHSAFS